jgi:hypothetical protein
MARVVEVDLFNTDADVLVHQCNCLTVRPHGLAEDIERRLPYAAFYGRRASVGWNMATAETCDSPGTIKWLDDPAGERPTVVALLAQWRPGKPGAPHWDRYPESDPKETTRQRVAWFKRSLDLLGHRLTDLRNAASDQSAYRVPLVAFPWQIGCGLAGGSWVLYRAAIQAFEAKFQHACRVIVCKLPRKRKREN